MTELRDPRIAGMITYPMDEMLLAALVGVLCGAEDFDGVESIGLELAGWLPVSCPSNTAPPRPRP